MARKKTTKRKTLTKRQQATMRRHRKHHTRKHMAFMKRLMLQGKTFTQAHRAAMKKVGR
tara:strand:- start:424 stop:600 length:177 start_codon:yes stop_codon:yes gene_type:complete